MNRRRSRLVAFGVAAMVAVTSAPAQAVGRRTVVPCRSSNSMCWPTAFDFSSRRKIFYIERFTGQIRVHNRRNGHDHRWGTIGNLATSGEQGLLGLALDPRWPRRRWVYIYYTRSSPLENRIIRLRKHRDGSFTRRLLARIPASGNHNGGALAFGPNRRLFAVTGDASNMANAQSLSNLAGKVLRMTVKGAAPSTNPFSGKRIFSYGHRNSFGLTFDPWTHRPWQTENGPNCNDEVNLPLSGRNFGWGPNASCPNTNQDGPNPVPPRLTFPGPGLPALTGAAFCKGCGLAGMHGRLLFGAFNDGNIRSVALASGRMAVSGNASVLYTNADGILMMKRFRGNIYFSDPSGIRALTP